MHCFQPEYDDSKLITSLMVSKTQYSFSSVYVVDIFQGVYYDTIAHTTNKAIAAVIVLFTKDMRKYEFAMQNITEIGWHIYIYLYT